jgi:hypothetical protein
VPRYLLGPYLRQWVKIATFQSFEKKIILKRAEVRVKYSNIHLRFIFFQEISFLQRGPGSSFRIATELRVGLSGDRIPMRARFSAPVQTGPGAHPASCTVGTGSFPGGRRRPGRDADPSPPSSAEI